MPRFPHLCARIFAVSTALNAQSVSADEVTRAAWERFQTRAAGTLAALNNTVVAQEVNTMTAAGLSFSDFLLPAGDGGLEFTPRLRSLNGTRVRLSGYMVRQPIVSPGVYILAPAPLALEAPGACFAIEIPAHAVHVHAGAPQQTVRTPFRPGRIGVIGILELGPRRETDGRRSYIRIKLDKAEMNTGSGGGASETSQPAPAP
jgi:hypothetical protein